MIGDHLFDLRLEGELSFLQSFCQKLGGMKDFKFSLRILILQRIEPMRAQGEDVRIL